MGQQCSPNHRSFGKVGADTGCTSGHFGVGTGCTSGHFGVRTGRTSGHLGVRTGHTSGHFGVSTGRTSGHFGVSTGCTSGHFGVRTGCTSGHLGVRTGRTSGHFGVSTGRTSGHFGVRTGRTSGHFGMRTGCTACWQGGIDSAHLLHTTCIPSGRPWACTRCTPVRILTETYNSITPVPVKIQPAKTMRCGDTEVGGLKSALMLYVYCRHQFHLEPMIQSTNISHWCLYCA